MKTILAILFCAIIAETRFSRRIRNVDTRCWSSGNGSPIPQFWMDGERIDKGRFWYVCASGELVPKGCFTEQNNRINVGESCRDKGYAAKCELGADGKLQLKYTGCIDSKGNSHEKGSQWIDQENHLYYQCKADGPYTKAVVEGCVAHDQETKLKFGERVQNGDYMYECRQRFNGSVHMCSVGCVHEGVHHDIGTQWTSGSLVYYCQSKNGECTKTVVGCNYENKKLYDGDRYRKGDTVYQCEIRENSHDVKPVGCIRTELDGSKTDRVIGCRWYLQGADFKIEQTCVVDGEATKVETVGCIYRYKGFDTIFLHPDTYTIWRLPRVLGESVGIACKSEGGSARLFTFEPSEASYATQGLKFSEPNSVPEEGFRS